MPNAAPPQLWTTHFEALQDSALSWLRHNGYDEPSAWDVWQQVVAQVLASGASPDPARMPTAYLWTVTRRLVHRDRARTARRPRSASEPTLVLVEDACETPYESSIRVEERGVVRDAVETLPDHFRQVVERRYFRGHSVARVAQELAIPDNTVATRTHRALRLLAPRLAALRALALVAVIGGLAWIVLPDTLVESRGVAHESRTSSPLAPVAPPVLDPVEYPRDGLAEVSPSFLPSTGFPYGDSCVMQPMPEI